LSSHRLANMLIRAHTTMTAQKHNKVCHDVATNVSSQSEIAERINRAMEKLIEAVIVQFPT
jgi:hypothetical protein